MDETALLKKLDFFSSLTTEELFRMSEITEPAVFKKDEEVVREGTPCDSLFVIKKGSARVLKEGKLLITLEEGSPIGEVSFVDRGKRSATVIADSDMEAVKIPLHAFERFLETEKGIGLKVYSSIAVILSQRLRDTNDTLMLYAAEKG
ncbi:MAG: cyclic nucleotide-binding domain-containing protein [Thermodesulfovibrionales bacterium]|nr:cyclic nucleotide-binding domain-containing protein [Thermodesulfovibrionales bacterium]